MRTFSEPKSCKKLQKKYTCKSCDYFTSRKSSYDKHVLTAKHQKRTLSEPKKLQKLQKIYSCRYCEKEFKSKSGRWGHEKKCKCKELKEEVNQLRQKLAEQENRNLKEKIKLLEQNNIKTQNNINTQNNIINFSFYLNEHCKDAVPIMDFIKDLQFTLTDIDPDRPASTIESLSKVITDKLSGMEETERPVHCSDAKRLNFYIKDASAGWVKDIDNKKIDKAIGFANMRHQCAWHSHAKQEGLDNAKKDTNYHIMNMAMAKFSDNPNKAKRKIKRAIADATNFKKIKEIKPNR